MSSGALIEATTLGELLRRTAARHPDRDALVFPDERVTYSQFVDRVDEIARALLTLGVREGDHVGVLMPNCVDYMAVFYGAMSLGAVAVPVNSRFKTTELSYVVANADLKVLFTSDSVAEFVDYPALLAEAIPGLSEAGPGPLNFPEVPLLRHVVLYGRPRPGFLSAAELPALAEQTPASEVAVFRERVRIRDIALTMYTSGTTDKPKGCMLTHESLVRNGMNFARTRFLLGPADRVWNPLPFFHMGAFLPFSGCIDAGAAMISMSHFEPGVALRLMEQERATIAYPAFETIWLAVLNHPDFERTDLHRLRIVLNVGVPERLRMMQEKVPWASQTSAFGSTEGSGTICYNHPDEPLEARLTTAGRPFPGMRVKVVDPATGEELPPNERGELLYKGYAVFEGYYKEPELTAASFTPDGWFRTGDLGKVDEEGRVTYLGRIKDMLKVGGENVAAVEIEDFIATHPAVNVVAVVAAPDDYYVEVPAAFIELRPGHTVTAEEIIEYCRGRIASFKIPRYVRFVNEWPMSGTKIQKFRLRERIQAELRSVPAGQG